MCQMLRNLALQCIDKNVTHCLEMIGHSWVDEDHVEKRVNDLLELESKLGIRVGAIGCLTKGVDSSNSVENWIEGAIFVPNWFRRGSIQEFQWQRANQGSSILSSQC